VDEGEEKEERAQDQYQKNGKKSGPASHALAKADPGDFDFEQNPVEELEEVESPPPQRRAQR
jgi:hypothetical protein